MKITQSDIMVTNYPGHSPVINFDGEAGIKLDNGVRSMDNILSLNLILFVL